LLQPVAPSVRRKQEYFMRNFLLTAVFAAASLFGVAAQAAEFQAGKEYVELSSPVPVADPSKIEVVELFLVWLSALLSVRTGDQALGRTAAG